MEQNNFEKNIQRKLGELKIPPSDSVWANVEKKIGKKKKDRKMILIVLFLILFLLSGGYWLFNSVERNSHLQDHQVSNVEKKDSKQTNIPDSSLKQITILHGNNANVKNGSSNVSEVKAKTSRVITQNTKGQSVFNNNQTNTQTEPMAEKEERIISSSLSKDKNDKKIFSDEKKNVTVNQNDLTGKELVTVDIKKGNNVWVPGIIAKSKIITDTLIKNKREDLAVKKDSIAKKSSKDLQKHKWMFGITLSGGKSMIGENPLGINNGNNNYVQSMPGTGPVSNPPVYPPSKLKGSVAFIGGIFIEKNISARNKISLGISYKYFSLLSKVGNRIDSLISFPSQYSITSSYLYNSVNNSHTYRNNFHYLKIPVSLKFQLGNSKTLPIYWDVGINISQLISSNALQYQPGTGIYYNDNSLINKTLISLQTGFSVVLFSKGKNPFSIGPYFSYSPSGVADKGLYEKKHFSFIGIHTEVLFKKK